jgi:hypothetical protein
MKKEVKNFTQLEMDCRVLLKNRCISNYTYWVNKAKNDRPLEEMIRITARRIR